MGRRLRILRAVIVRLRVVALLVAALAVGGSVVGATGATAAEATPTAQWGTPAALSDGTRDALGVAVASAAQAVPFTAWQEWDGKGFAIYAARYLGDRWTAPVRLSRAPAEDGTVRIAANLAGGAIVVWRSAAGNEVSAAVYANGSWGEPLALAGVAARSARVAMDADGAATITWTARDESGTRRVRAVRIEAISARV